MLATGIALGLLIGCVTGLGAVFLLHFMLEGRGNLIRSFVVFVKAMPFIWFGHYYWGTTIAPTLFRSVSSMQYLTWLTLTFMMTVILGGTVLLYLQKRA